MKDIILRILGVNKIKYNILDDEIGTMYEDSEILNLHIDLNSLLSPLYKKELDQSLRDHPTNLKFTISSGIINLCAHFRAYCIYRQHGLDNRIFFYFNNKKETEFKYIKSAVKQALELVQIISKYCPNVYYIKNGFPTVSCKHIMETHNGDNLILSKREDFYQCIDESTSILRLKRDETNIITHETIYDFILRKNMYDPENKISSGFLPVLYSYEGISNVPKIKGVGKVKLLKLLDKGITDNKIVNEYYPNVDFLIDDLKLPKATELKENYNKVDLRYLYKNIGKAFKKKVDDSLVNKFSKEDLMSLNTTYYTGFESLMLQELVLQPNNSKKVNW